MKKALLAVGLLLVLGVAQAQANTIAYQTPSSNDVVGEKWGYLGGALYAFGSDMTITVEFIGKEAGWTNQFFFNDLLRYSTSSYDNSSAGTNPSIGDTCGTCTGIPITSGLLNFMFTSNQGTGDFERRFGGE